MRRVVDRVKQALAFTSGLISSSSGVAARTDGHASAVKPAASTMSNRDHHRFWPGAQSTSRAPLSLA